jgi:hypothetical protein
LKEAQEFLVPSLCVSGNENVGPAGVEGMGRVQKVT